MEVVAATPNGGGVPPFHDHDVREWSRIDSLTGVLERARLETDHWTANTNNSSHKYGKVVDSRARSDADGALQQQARRQLEVFQSQIPGGHLQVIKTHTVSSSRWTNKNSSNSDSTDIIKDFENLKLPLNRLDLSSQKSKATVGRSVGRRPPSRRIRDEIPSSTTNVNHLRKSHLTAATNLHRVSRLCHQIHDSAVKQAFDIHLPKPNIKERQSGDGSVEIYEIESSVTSSETKSVNGHSELLRTKSTSSEDIFLLTPEKDSSAKSVEDLEDLEQLQNWRRSSKIRRSLQLPKQNKLVPTKPIDLPENSVNVKKIRDDLEKGRRLNTALRGNNVDLEALDQILQTISSSNSSSSDKTSTTIDNTDLENDLLQLKKQKKNSFVTVESLQEVKGRLRRTSSPTNYTYPNSKEDIDDGIVTEETSNKMLNGIAHTEKSKSQTRVRSYVYGMEAMLNKNSSLGTGSLESRSKFVNGNTTNRNEDWYNRRKSYGFEQVHNHDDSISFKNKNHVESSTDSGICRSSEIVIVPTTITPNKTDHYNSEYSHHNDKDNEFIDQKQNGISFGNVKKISSIFNQDRTTYDKEDNNTNTWSLRSSYSDRKPKEDTKSTTITIPIIAKSSTVDIWKDEPEREFKRHSIAVDESKYVIRDSDNKFRRTSLAINDQILKHPFNLEDDEHIINGRKTKKVEFCKTEVHFAADSGKVNIVETDEKPPPTQNFRRRRRNSGPIINFGQDCNKNDLPMLHFGDSSYEKNLFGVTEDDNNNPELRTPENNFYENIQPKNKIVLGTVTVNHNNLECLEEKKELTEIEKIKGILKNKPIKPKPYHLGDPFPLLGSMSDDEQKWGIRLKPTPNEEKPIWKSSVTVQNTVFDQKTNQKENKDDNVEFQQLLRNLRPTKKAEVSDEENRFSDNFSSIRIIPPHVDNRRSSWSVADRIKFVEDSQILENKGYSTRVNFGDGEATVVESDFEKEKHPTWPRKESSVKDATSCNTERVSQDISNPELEPKERKKYNVVLNRKQFSPVVVRRATTIDRPILKTVSKPDNLSSPALVGKNVLGTTDHNHVVAQLNGEETDSKDILKDRYFLKNEYKNTESKLQAKRVKEIVLRQPKKSELTYFGVNVSPKPIKNMSETVTSAENKLSDKPDLLKDHSNTGSKYANKTINNEECNGDHIYENIHVKASEAKNKYASKEFNSNILDELTKAADQILQAVNGYTDEDSHNKHSSDDEELRKCKLRNEQLETISETKSLKQNNQSKLSNSKPPNSKPKLKHTSSTSSIDSVSKERKRISPERKATTTRISPDKSRKKDSTVESVTTKSNTKARRLQRASSREALLQSHGSSSEDLAVYTEAPIRKPRLIKKTKATQLTITNGLELTKKTPASTISSRRREEIHRDERISANIPEIRHKTAVSNIRNVSEKRDRTRHKSEDRVKHKNEDLKKKLPHKREISRGVQSSSRTEKSKNTTSKETVTHRTSTANIKKCHRSESAARH